MEKKKREGARKVRKEGGMESFMSSLALPEFIS